MSRNYEPEPGPQSFLHLIVRFQSHLVLGMEQGRLTARTLQGHPVDLAPFHAIVDQAGGRARQSYPRIAADLSKRGIRSTTGIDRYVDVIVPRLPASRVDALNGSLSDLRDLVVFAMEAWPYVPAGPPPIDPKREEQGYLKPRMYRGVSAECAWQVGGADGSGVTVCLCDFNFQLHDDLPQPARTFGTLPPSASPADFEHANSARGVIAAIKDNGIGVTGISPQAVIWFATTNGIVKVFPADNSVVWKPFETVLDCVYCAMPDGGIVVFEMQAERLGTPIGDVIAPAEMNPTIRAWIREAADNRGILTIVPAGTGPPSVNLNTLDSPYIVPETDPELWRWEHIWDGLPETDLNHSLGVMVGGGHPDTQEAISSTNFGKRVDCQGWGSGVVTAGLKGDPLRVYVDDFNGTSSAAAIIGGVAASLQGAHQAAYGTQLSPKELRRLLSSPILGLPQPVLDAVERPIGPLPDLAAMLRNLRILGDVYIRDSLKDAGATPHKAEATFLSPDIIVNSIGRPWNAGDQSFWDEHVDEDLQAAINPGSLGDVLVRVFNRSRNPGTVKVNAYWTEPGLFLDPGIWHGIGPEAQVTVPPYDYKVVPIQWRQNPKPDTDKICLIATVDSECDPLGIKERFKSLKDYKRFLRRSNNIAHRNLQCFDVPSSQKEAHFSFFLRGILRMEDWIQDQGFFRLVIEGRLPRGTRIALHSGEPLYGEGSDASGLNPGVLYQVVAPAPLILGGIRLPAGARIPMRLLVTLPDDAPAMEFYLHANQFHDDDLIGRGNFLIRYGQDL